jgi:hypothetical protein
MKELDYSNWKRDYRGDQPALHGDHDNLRSGAAIILQQVGFNVDGTLVQMSYDRALQLGLIDKSEDRWEMSHVQYLEENGQ